MGRVVKRNFELPLRKSFDAYDAGRDKLKLYSSKTYITRSFFNCTGPAVTGSRHTATMLSCIGAGEPRSIESLLRIVQHQHAVSPFHQW
jgi:hypothetical protein